MTVLTFDLEVECHTYNKRKAGPFDPRNYIVQIGYKYDDGPCQEVYYDKWHRDPVMPDLTGVTLLVGFNIKFDLLWVWQEPAVQEFLKRGGQIYCGQYAEYLLQGFDPAYHMCSMNQLAEEYGGGVKIDAVKEMWEAGVLTSEIPRNLLTDYLIGDGGDIVGDIQNTYLIFKGQVERMKALPDPTKFKTMMRHRFDGLLATTEMEYNGMFINQTVAERDRINLMQEIVDAQRDLEQYIPDLPDGLEFKWSSNIHKSCLIYGGVVSYKKWVQHVDDDGNPLFAMKTVTEAVTDEDGNVVLYKSGKKQGQIKTKQAKYPDHDKPKGALKEHYFEFKGYATPKAEWKTKATDAYGQPIYSTGADIILELGKSGIPFTVALATFVGKTKDVGTYYWIEKAGKKKGMLTLVGEDGIIHHSLNHTSTVTGRMSSSNPNLQNIPRGDTSNVKAMFTSRFEDGLVAEIDYSQLEVVCQGVLSGDENLRRDLRNGVDFHCKRVALVEGIEYALAVEYCKVQEIPEWKVKRTNAKQFSFQRAYGAGAAAVVASTGMSRELVDALIEAEALEYPEVDAFYTMVDAERIATRETTSNKIYLDGIAFTQGKGVWHSPTGTIYSWREGITPTFLHEHGKYTGFSPTELRNYPVQGFGGEIVQTMLGKVFRWMIKNDRFDNKVLLMNSVHDCVLLDGHKDKLPEVAKGVQSILESVPEVFNNAFEMDIDVPFPCETEVGPDLLNMTVLH